MKPITKILLIVIFLFSSMTVFSDDDPTYQDELLITNKSDVNIYLKLYPKSAVFVRYPRSTDAKFKLLTNHYEGIEQGFLRRNAPYGLPLVKYAVGLDRYALTHNQFTWPGYYSFVNDQSIGLEFDGQSQNQTDGLIGYGIYSLEFYWDDGFSEELHLLGQPVTLDYSDLNYVSPNVYGGYSDLYIEVTSVNTNNLTFQAIYRWDSPGNGYWINLYDNELPEGEKGIIKIYRQFWQYVGSGGNMYICGESGSFSKWNGFCATPNYDIKGISDNDNLLFPINGTDLPLPNYKLFDHPNPGLLVSPLYIQPGHQPKVKCGRTFEVDGRTYTYLKLESSSNTKFYVGDEDNNQNCDAVFIGHPHCFIWLKASTELIVKKGAGLCLLNYSDIYMEINSKIILKDGAHFLTSGALFRGDGYQNGAGIVYEGKIRRSLCYFTPDSPTYFDSIGVMLENGSELEIPDSTTWIFQGSETALHCDSGSTIKFGKNSKLIFTDGARINAKHTKFTTLDSNTTWNGIYLSGVSYDTLQYCTIENALNGINIEDKYSFFTSAPATEISNCEFSNKTSEQLLNMVYVNNSANVMIRNCTSTSLINDGFASGVIIEYSTAGGVNVIDNEIEYVTTGINVIQSSPYIARNRITGSGQSLPAAGRRNRAIP